MRGVDIKTDNRPKCPECLKASYAEMYALNSIGIGGGLCTLNSIACNGTCKTEEGIRAIKYYEENLT